MTKSSEAVEHRTWKNVDDEEKTATPVLNQATIDQTLISNTELKHCLIQSNPQVKHGLSEPYLKPNVARKLSSSSPLSQL